MNGKFIILKNRSKLGSIDWFVSSLFFTIEIQTRTLSKGQTVTVLFIYLRIYFSSSYPSENSIWWSYKKICILVFKAGRKWEFGHLSENFWKYYYLYCKVQIFRMPTFFCNSLIGRKILEKFVFLKVKVISIFWKKWSKLGTNDWLVSPLFFTIESQTRTLSKEQNVKIPFIFLRLFFSLPPPL